MPSVIQAAKEVVERARAGDQNAMAMIVMVRDQAIQGNEKARESQRAILEYIRKNPVQVADAFAHSHVGEDAKQALAYVSKRGPVLGLIALFIIGSDSPDAMLNGSIILANGPRLTNPRISAIGSAIDNDDERRLFYAGVCFKRIPPNLLQRCVPEQRPIINAGKCVGLARAIQEVRAPDSSLTKFSPVVGWEHGEVNHGA